MLRRVSGRIGKMIAEQASMEQLPAAEPTKDFDETNGNGPIKSTAFVKMLYADMATD